MLAALPLWENTQDSSFGEGIGEVEVAGSKNGREPEGEAWLVDGWVRNGMPFIKR